MSARCLLDRIAGYYVLKLFGEFNIRSPNRAERIFPQYEDLGLSLILALESMQ
jgi:hypothetical protein